MLKVSQLSIYPIKSMGGISRREIKIFSTGPEWDREWMLIDEKGTFVSQRSFPILAAFQTYLTETDLVVEFEGKSWKLPLALESGPSPSETVNVEVWGQKFPAQWVQNDLSHFISEKVKQPLRLVRYRQYSKRLKSAIHPDFQPEVRFADAMSILMFSTASLEDLNKRLQAFGKKPVPADRFRGNLIFESVKPFIEDNWQRIRVGDVVFSQPKKCARCVMITIDQKAGHITGPEPLKTLADFRRDGNKVMFGQQFIPENEGVIRLGDEVQVLL